MPGRPPGDTARDARTLRRPAQIAAGNRRPAHIETVGKTADVWSADDDLHKIEPGQLADGSG